MEVPLHRLIESFNICRGLAQQKRGQVMGNHCGDGMSPFATCVGISGAGRPIFEMDGRCNEFKNMMVAMFGIHQHLRQGNMK